MSQLTLELGYGKSGTVELDCFTRMLNSQIYDNEEIRFDKPTVWSGTYEYMGLAPSGSNPDDPVWNCIRRTWENNRCVRTQYQANIPWSFKWIGWN